MVQLLNIVQLANHRDPSTREATRAYPDWPITEMLLEDCPLGLFSPDDQLCCRQAPRRVCCRRGYHPADASSFQPTHPGLGGGQSEGEGSPGEKLEFGLIGLFRSSAGRPCRLILDGRSFGTRRGVAKPWVALDKRRTRVATERVVSDVVE